MTEDSTIIRPTALEKKGRKKAAQQTQRVFADGLIGVAWALLQKKNRSKDDDEKLLYAAFASAFHWLEVGTGAHHQRAEWLISRVYYALGNATESIRHAERCAELTARHLKELADFDRAFSLEALARAHALAGDVEEAKEYYDKAKAAVDEIEREEDKKIFLDEFNAGNWHGIA